MTFYPGGRFGTGRVGALSRLVVIAAWLAAAGAAPGQTNLIRNPGFEEGESPGFAGVGKYWETNDGLVHPEVDALTTATKHSGTWSQWLKANSTWDLGMLRQVTAYNSITPGKTYLISAWIKTQNVANPAGWYVFGIWWFNNDTVIGDSKMPQQETLNYDWRQISWTVVAPAGANRAAALLTRHTDGNAWYDDVFIGEYDPDPPVIARSPASFVRFGWAGRHLRDDTITIQNSGGNALNYTLTDGADWLDAVPSSGSSTGETDLIALQYDLAGLEMERYAATITIVADGATNSPQMIDVALTVTVPGDADLDFDVDLEDFAHFQVCLSGGGQAQDAPECADARLDEDVDVDEVDLSIFMACLSGANVRADPDCGLH